MTLFIRSIVDAICGAAVVCVIAVGMVALMSLPTLVRDTGDRDVMLRLLPDTLKTAAVGGLVLGGLAGFAARITQGRASFMRCLLFIGGFAGFARLVTAPHTKGADYLFTNLATLIAAIAGAAIVVTSSRPIKNRLPSNDQNSNESAP
jgi:hypothetical protein